MRRLRNSAQSVNLCAGMRKLEVARISWGRRKGGGGAGGRSGQPQGRRRCGPQVRAGAREAEVRAACLQQSCDAGAAARPAGGQEQVVALLLEGAPHPTALQHPLHLRPSATSPAAA